MTAYMWAFLLRLQDSNVITGIKQTILFGTSRIFNLCACKPYHHMIDFYEEHFTHTWKKFYLCKFYLHIL